MPDYYFQAKVCGFLFDCEEKPTEEEVARYIREDISTLDVEVEVIKED